MSLRLIARTAFALLSCLSSAMPQGPVDPQKASTTRDTDGAAEAQALLTSPDARLAASYRCATSDASRESELSRLRNQLVEEVKTAKENADTLRAKAASLKPPTDETEEAARTQAETAARNADETLAVSQGRLGEVDTALRDLKRPATPCPLTDELASRLSLNFRQPLLNTEDKPTQLATDLTTLLKSTYASEPVVATDSQIVVVHLVHRLGEEARAREARGEKALPSTERSVEEKPVVAADRWILAERRGNHFTFSEGSRILGKHTIGLVFVHLGGVTSSTAAAESVYGNVTYRALIERKLPANLQNLIAILKLTSAFQSKDRNDLRTVAYLGYGVLRKVDVPSDITLFGVDLVQDKAAVRLIASSKKYDNEGKYWWDVSVAVPVNKLSLVEYSNENNTFIPRTVNKQSIYALFNLYPVKVDIKSGLARHIIPRAIAGLGLTGRPGENILVGGAWGFRELQFFLGSAFANHRTLRPGTDPANGANYEQRYSSRFSYGLNIPVVEAIKKLTPKKN